MEEEVNSRALQFKDLYIFDGLSREEIVYFIMMSEIRSFRKGDIIMSEGDISDHYAYLIETGSVNVFRNKKHISSLHPGDLFGELALIVNEPRVATVVAADVTRCLAFNKEEFMELMRRSGRHVDLKKLILGRIRENFRDDFQKLQ